MRLVFVSNVTDVVVTEEFFFSKITGNGIVVMVRHDCDKYLRAIGQV